jgi:hypothetical protein
MHQLPGDMKLYLNTDSPESPLRNYARTEHSLHIPLHMALLAQAIYYLVSFLNQLETLA